MTEHSANEIINLIKKKGYEEHHTTGDHHIYKNKSGKMIFIPYTHLKDSISIGTYKSIVRMLDSK
ncbi:type II toxin-antitoxin system HicA family toxin [Lactobacillus sp. ESL0233]|uniref:type II toxin-antitoxin system HicA family toxin n=1 Tax=Lactobacillus sp. ESL0233 TaxID=2069354 RepID=UPI000EFAB20D|nr:type II toxin-antitoxin system HicA family toxin [Lactobacillus sp. ESL0233]RMC41569.1 type II toxin-antitoxin system HicA family toxin [Lactobacillus sp. ESL0233]